MKSSGADRLIIKTLENMEEAFLAVTSVGQ
jgi:hypothetical protein